MAPVFRVSPPDQLITESQAASLLGLKPRWLQLDRFGMRRVPFVRIGRMIRYRRSAIEAFLESSTVPAGSRE